MARSIENGSEKPSQENLEDQPSTPETPEESLLSSQQMQDLQERAGKELEEEKKNPEKIEELKKEVEGGGKEAQDPKSKLADEIMGRSKNSYPQVKEKAEMFAKKVRDGLSLKGIENDFRELMDSTPGSNPEAWSNYRGFLKKDIKDLYAVLYGETIDGEDWETYNEKFNNEKQFEEDVQREAEEIRKDDFLKRSEAEIFRLARERVKEKKRQNPQLEKPKLEEAKPTEPKPKGFFRKLFGG